VRARCDAQPPQAGDVVKEYVALVEGVFPERGELLDCACVLVDQPLLYDYQLRRTAVGTGRGSKPAATAFRLLASHGGRSLVACRPLTGRTHQLRAHLHHLGYPIANDCAYGGTAQGAPPASAPAPAPPPDEAGEAASDDVARFAPRPRLEACDPPGGRHGGEADPLCTHCPWLAPQGQAHDVEPLWLHACRYAGATWRFQAPLPDWATDMAPLVALPEALWAGIPQHTLHKYHGGAGEDKET